MHDDAIQAIAARLINDLRQRDDWTALTELTDRRILGMTLQVIGEYDLDLLVQIASEAINPPDHREPVGP